MNAYGKKNPENQNILGFPYLIHFVKKFIHSLSSKIQVFKGFNDKKPLG